MHIKKILVVDDQPGILDSLPLYLAHHGYTSVVTAASGKEGIEKLKNDPEIDLIITDKVNPGVTDLSSGGRDLTSFVHRTSGKPVIVMSGTFSPEDTKESFPAIHLLSKPFTNEDIKKALAVFKNTA